MENTSLSAAVKIHTLMDRLFSAGLSNPSEKTVQMIVAMLSALHSPGADTHALWSMSQAVKKPMQGRRGASLSALKDFPYDAKNLPRALYDHAYPDPEAGPVPKDIPGMRAVLPRVPMRNNNKLLKSAQQNIPAAPLRPLPSSRRRTRRPFSRSACEAS